MSQHIHILDASGAVINTILASPEFAEAQHPGAWRLSDEQPGIEPEPTAPAPQTVTAFQAKAALLESGLLDDIEALMADVNTPRIVKLAWSEALTFERQSPTVLMLATALGLSADELDTLFAAASQITA
jgi:hypothetical protein